MHENIRLSIFKFYTIFLSVILRDINSYIHLYEFQDYTDALYFFVFQPKYISLLPIQHIIIFNYAYAANACH